MQKRIKEFFLKHHIFTLATAFNNIPYVATCFYCFDEDNLALIFASSKESEHMRHALSNPEVACAIHLSTHKIGTIQGVQCRGRVYEASKVQKERYFAKYPLAKAMSSSIWALQLEWVKMTDNRLGFGKKLIWSRLADQ